METEEIQASEEYRARVDKMTLEEARTEYSERATEVRGIADAGEGLTPEQDARFDPAYAETKYAETVLKSREERAKRLEEVRGLNVDRASGDGGLNVIIAGPKGDKVFGDVREIRSMTRTQRLDAAKRVIEERGKDLEGSLSPESQAHVAHLVRQNSRSTDGDIIAERMLLTENPDYRSAFMKGTTERAPAFTNEEARALDAFREFSRRTEFRTAEEGTGSLGGYGIPVLIDPTIILSSGALEAPILSICRIETITTDAWKGVTAPGSTWAYTAEAGVVTDGTPTLTQPNIPVYRASGFIPYTIELGQDYPGFAGEMSKLLGQGYVDLVAVNSMTGSGSSQPRGIFTALAATTASQLEVTTSGTLGGVDIRTLWSKVPERFRPHATWVMNASVMAIVRGLGNSLALADYTVSLTQSDTQFLEGKPVIETDYAPSYVNTTGVQNFMCVGDFSNFLLVQRAGMTVELVPTLFDTSTGRPTGERGWFAWARHGYDSLNSNAFRMLVNTTPGLNA